MSRPRLLTASTDRTLPAKHEGKLEPNYFCRGWNANRVKYCRARAGAGTSHPGLGRCRHHGGLKRGGDPRVKSGRESAAKRQLLSEFIAGELLRADPLDLSRELATLRAVFADFHERQADVVQVDHESAAKLLDAIGRMVERIERIRSQNAISRPELNRIMHELWRAVDGRITDEKIKGEIREDWMRIAL